MRTGIEAKNNWEEGIERSQAGSVCLLTSSWAALEPERGRYDDAVVHRMRKVLVEARNKDVEVMLCLHDGALPDWILEGGGWLDPDANAAWGCYVDTLVRTIAELVGSWVVFDGMVEEARAYGPASSTVLRRLLDAHATAYLLLHRTVGTKGRSQVGALEWVYSPGGVLQRLTTEMRELQVQAVGRSLLHGRLYPPIGWIGELPNGSPALDFWGIRLEGRGTRRPTERGAQRALAEGARLGLPLLLAGFGEMSPDSGFMEGTRIDYVVG